MKKLLKFITINILATFMVLILKLILVLITGSVTLITEVTYTFTELITNVMSYFGIVTSHQPIDEKHPLGLGHFEYIISLISGMVLFFLGYVILQDVINLSEVPKFNIYGVYGFIIVIIIKIIMARKLLFNGYKYDNQILLSNGYGAAGDVMSTFMILLSMTYAYLDYEWITDFYIIAGIIIVIIIISLGTSILIRNMRLLINPLFEDEDDRLKELVFAVSKDIKNIPKLVVLKHGPYYHVMVDIEIPPTHFLNDAHDIVNEVEKKLLLEDKVSLVRVHAIPYFEEED